MSKAPGWCFGKAPNSLPYTSLRDKTEAEAKETVETHVVSVQTEAICRPDAKMEEIATQTEESQEVAETEAEARGQSDVQKGEIDTQIEAVQETAAVGAEMEHRLEAEMQIVQRELQDARQKQNNRLEKFCDGLCRKYGYVDARACPDSAPSC